ncbi:MAG: hypothetical protein V3V78_01070 [Candidatus Woesearchaeota archaeon]
MGIKEENYFLLKDGTIVKNLFELSKALDKMPEDTFEHHVNESRNDFYSWIKEVVKDQDLATKVLSANSRKQIQKEIAKKIEKDTMKGMDKKTATKIKTTAKKPAARPKIARKQVQTVKNKAHAAKNRLHNMFFKEEGSKTKKRLSQMSPEEIKYGINCPYKTLKCGLLEFIFGVILGVLIALVLTAIF